MVQLFKKVKEELLDKVLKCFDPSIRDLRV